MKHLLDHFDLLSCGIGFMGGFVFAIAVFVTNRVVESERVPGFPPSLDTRPLGDAGTLGRTDIPVIPFGDHS